MDTKRKNRPEDQEMPVPNDLPSMHDAAVEAIQARKALGVSRYGVALQPANGRNAIQDLAEEVVDAAVYAAQVVWEQDNPAETYVGRLIDAIQNGDDHVYFKGVFVPDAVVRELDNVGISYVK